MAPRNKSSLLSSSSPIHIGNCEVIVEARNFSSDWNHNSLQINLSKNAKIKISVVEGTSGGNTNNAVPEWGIQEDGQFYFLLLNPKDADTHTKSLLQQVLDMYSKELPAMNYAANTGKESMFLERCVSNGKYCTLLLKFNGDGRQGEVISAITYQIVPADTQYAEIPLAAVSSKYQKKGIGHMLYTELRERLQKVGICTIFCWGDKESEGFWLKQGFVVIGEVDTKGRARRLPVKADIRKALCFPGGSTLMVSHLSKDSAHPAEQLKISFPLEPPKEHCSSDIILKQLPGCVDESPYPFKGVNHMISSTGNSPPDNLEATERFLKDVQRDVDCIKPENCNHIANDSGFVRSGDDDEEKMCSCSALGTKKRVWEASHTSLKSKKVKGGHAIDCQIDSRDSASGSDTRNNDLIVSSSFICWNKLFGDGDVLTNNGVEKNDDDCGTANLISEHNGRCKVLSTEICFRIMLMNIADDKKKLRLTKIIEDLGGTVTSDGTVATHIVTGQVRKTLNFCVGLCSGAWIISPNWLKESFRKGRFLDEVPFILSDEDYECKYRTELRVAVLQAKASPHSLLKGRDICLSAHVQPPVPTLSAIIKSAGGEVIGELDKVKEPSKAIFVACEEDMEEALLAVKKGIQTFSSEWLMNCIMRQELDLETLKFAESL